MTADSETTRAWQARNRDRYLAIRRRFRERHRAALSVARKTYRQANKDKERAAQAAWYQAHRDERCAYTRRWLAEHPGYQHEKQAKHRDRTRGYCARRRARRVGCISHHTDQEWADMRLRCGGCCLACGARRPLERDHIQPLSKGGDDGIANIQPLCRSCNASKNSKTIDYRP